MFDLPEPFGPTTTATPGSRRTSTGSGNDLNPRRRSERRCTGRSVTATADGPPCRRAGEACDGDGKEETGMTGSSRLVDAPAEPATATGRRRPASRAPPALSTRRRSRRQRREGGDRHHGLLPPCRRAGGAGDSDGKEETG